MNLFDVPNAQYYCRSFGGTAGVATGSLRQHVALHLAGVTSLRQGTVGFNTYRDCALRDVDRSLFLAVSHYRPALDLMIASASSWAYVTLYYGSFFTASALLGLFGGYVYKRTVVDVATNAPGQQELRIARNATPGGLGQHQAFWDLFYTSVAPLYAWVDPALVFSIQPFSGSNTWQITQFQAAFRRSLFPASLPAVLNNQFRIFDGLIRVTVEFVRQFGFRTDALNGSPQSDDAALKSGPSSSARTRRH